MVHCVDFVVGNSYQKLPKHKAKYDKSAQHLKVHDWTLYLDVVGGDPDLIERVTFDLGPSFSPSIFICPAPVQIKLPNGKIAWRFKTRQQTYGALTATLTIRGRGGTLHETTHFISLQEGSEERKAPVQQFMERRPLRPLKPLKMENVNFGIELELTSVNYVSVDAIANVINDNSSIFVDVIPSYREGRATSSNWKIVPDNS